MLTQAPFQQIALVTVKAAMLPTRMFLASFSRENSAVFVATIELGRAKKESEPKLALKLIWLFRIGNLGLTSASSYAGTQETCQLRLQENPVQSFRSS